jgi:hypothetical protein
MHISTNDLHCCKPARLLQLAPHRFGYVTSTGYAPVWRVVTISVALRHGMVTVGPCDSRTAVQGGHGLAVKTMFRFNPSSPN